MDRRLKTHENKRNWFVDFLYLLPAFAFVLSVAVIRLKKLSMPMTDIYWSEATDETTMTNLFTWWKSIVIMGAGCLAVAWMAIGYFSGQIRFKKGKYYIPLLVYLVWVFLSYAFSDYKYFALHGMNEHSEGIFVLVAYMLLVIFLANAVDSDRRLAYVLGCVLLVSAVLGVLGYTQANGHDFLATTQGQKLITPNDSSGQGLKMWEMIDLLGKLGQSAYSFSNSVYQTVYNPNYVPFYLILVVAVTALLFIYLFKEKKGAKKLLALPVLAVFALILYSFFAARSASGYVGLTALFLSAVVVFHRKIFQWIVPLLCLAVAMGGVMYVLQDDWWPEVKATFFSLRDNAIARIYADDDPIQFHYDYENAPASVFAPVDYIDCRDGHLYFSVNGSVLDFSRDRKQHAYVVVDGDGNQIYMTGIEGENNVFEILDDRFHDYVKLSLAKDENNITYLILTTKYHAWRFRYDGEEFWYLNNVGKEVLLHPIEHAGIFHNYSFGSGRGRIYDTTIPMLKHYVFIGAGPDNFPFVFPQNDYATRYSRSNGSRTALIQVTDKAHNIYLQYWVNTGLPSLLAWLALIGCYAVGAIKSFRRRGFETFADYINGGIFCGIFAFLATGLLSDGSVNTMPMFYTMLGLGLAINAKDSWVKPQPKPAPAASETEQTIEE